MKIIMQDPWGIRDLGTYDYSLCHALYKKGVNVSLITNTYYEYENLSDFKVERLFFKYSENMKTSFFRKLIRGLEYCYTMLKLVKIYSKDPPDIIHIQWLLFYNFDFIWLKLLKHSLRKKHTKIILTAHNILPHVEGHKYKNILEKIYLSVDGLIVHSKVLKEQVYEIFGEKSREWNILVSTIGTEIDLLKKVDKTILNTHKEKINELKAKGYNFLFIGIIHKNKGLDILLKAWEDHIKKFPANKLFIVGNLAYKMDEELIYINKNKQSIDTSFGYKTDEEMLAYFLESDFVVLPYREASQSGVLFNAFTFGKPVIVTDVGGLPEVVNTIEGGYVVESDNYVAFARVMNKISTIDKKELKKWGDNIQRKVKENYSWDGIADLTIKFYMKILGLNKNNERSL